MTFVSKMARRYFAEKCGVTDDDSISISHDSENAMRAALRSVKPEDVSDSMCREATLVWTDGRTPTYEQLRRAIAAAIAKGGSD